MHADRFCFANMLTSSFVELPWGFPPPCRLIPRAGRAWWAPQEQRHKPSAKARFRERRWQHRRARLWAPSPAAPGCVLTEVTLMALCDLPARVSSSPLRKAAQGVLADKPADTVRAAPNGFDSVNTSYSQEQLQPIELSMIMIYYTAVCLFCPRRSTPWCTRHRWGTAVVTGTWRNSTVLLHA